MKKLLHRRVILGLTALGLCFGSLVAAYALSEEAMTGQFTPKDYAVLTFEQAQKDLEDLQRAMRSSYLSPADFMKTVQEIASRSKAISQNRLKSSNDHIIDMTGMDLPTIKK